MGHIAHLSHLNPYSKIFATYSHVKIWSAIVASCYTWRLWILQTSICTISGSSQVNLNFSGTVVCKKIYEHSPYIYIACNFLVPYSSLTKLSGAMNLTNFNLHYIRKLQCKFQLFWLSGSWEEDFYLFVCLLMAAWAIFQLSGGCHHYRWQGRKFRPMLSTHDF